MSSKGGGAEYWQKHVPLRLAEGQSSVHMCAWFFLPLVFVASFSCLFACRLFGSRRFFFRSKVRLARPTGTSFDGHLSRIAVPELLNACRRCALLTLPIFSNVSSSLRRPHIYIENNMIARQGRASNHVFSACGLESGSRGSTHMFVLGNQFARTYVGRASEAKPVT